jgi:hypothetical protein
MPSCVYDRNKNFTFGNITKGQYKAYIINNTIINNNTRNTIETYHAVSGFSVYIINNLICYNEASYRGAVILDVQDNYCFHNTIFGNSKSGVYYTQNNMVKNNIIACNGGYGIIGPGGYDHNDVWNNSLGNYQQGLPGQGDISKDPLFNDPDNNDFHLTAASPCINAGAFISGVTYDIDYDHRPYGAGFDMGADEYVPLLHIEATIK